MEPVCIIGIGHRDRGDDALGRIAADRLRQRAREGLTILDIDGEATALVEHLGKTNSAILIDAALSDAAPGTIRRFDVAVEPLPATNSSMSTHGFGLSEGIELARALHSLPRRCIVFAVEARSFEVGDPLSLSVAAAVDPLVARVLEEVGAIGDA